jgi:hypothetical protein
MTDESKPTISKALVDKMFRHVRGGYLDMDWKVFDSDGNPDPKKRLFGGAWIVVEDAYTYVFLRVNEDMTLTEYTKEYE